MKTLKIKDKTRPVEPEQESYGMCCIESEWEALFQTYFKYLEGIGRASGSVENYKTSLSRFVKYLEQHGMVKAEAVTPKLLAQYQAWFFEAKSRFKKTFSINTQIIDLLVIKNFFRFLEQSGRIAKSPADHLQLPKEPHQLPATILTNKEMKKLLAQPDTNTVLGFRDRTMYEVLYSSGLRVGELIRLRVQDLNFDNGTLFIPENKHSRDRFVPFGDGAGVYLKEYLKNVRPLMLREHSDDTVFIGKRGKPLHITGIETKLRCYAGRAGIKKHLTIHTFRHSLATGMLQDGADLRHIQELLGHSYLKTTQIYTHIVKGELKRIQSKCHPREKSNLPKGVFKYRGRTRLTLAEKASEQRL